MRTESVSQVLHAMLSSNLVRCIEMTNELQQNVIMVVT